MKVSEARLNDLTYMALKRYFFEPFHNAGAIPIGAPRECDIRICMDMTCRERITSPMAAILLPNEESPASHGKVYEVEPSRILDEVFDYIEGHWLKCDLDVGADSPGWKERARKEYLEYIVPNCMELPEEDCGPVKPR